MLDDACRDPGVRFVSGASVLSLLVCALCSAGLAYPLVFLMIGAAALVHFAFLAALVWQVFSYGRRSGFPIAGACAALLVFASPVVGIDGTSAYNDVAVAAIAFTLFYLLQTWDDDRTWRLAAAIG